jgi:hypothetical protein
LDPSKLILVITGFSTISKEVGREREREREGGREGGRERIDPFKKGSLRKGVQNLPASQT